jgi:hypothetical protein
LPLKRFTLEVTDKSYRFLVDRQYDTTTFADYFVPCPWRVDDETPRGINPVFILLGTGKNKNMFVSNMLVERYFPTVAIPQKRRSRTRLAIPVETKNLNAIFVGRPLNFVLIFRKTKKVATTIRQQAE